MSPDFGFVTVLAGPDSPATPRYLSDSRAEFGDVVTLGRQDEVDEFADGTVSRWAGADPVRVGQDVWVGGWHGRAQGGGPHGG